VDLGAGIPIELTQRQAPLVLAWTSTPSQYVRSHRNEIILLQSAASEMSG